MAFVRPRKQPSQGEADPQTPRSPRLPRPISGPRFLFALVAALLIFLGLLWTASFLALQARGPDRAFLEKESWGNGTVVLLVTDIDIAGEVLVNSLTANLTSSGGVTFYGGPFEASWDNGNFTTNITFVDRDESTTLTKWDEVVIRVEPASALDALILANFYLYSNGREWARLHLV